MSDEFGRYTLEELWVEFYEDFITDHPSEIMEALGEDDNIRFVTGDPEYDELEARISAGTISDEEVRKILSSWEHSTNKEPESVPKSEPEPVVDLGSGFEDTY